MAKSRDAFRTISEVAEWLDTPAHVLRFWESKFSQVKPVKRAGGRRYYRPADMALLAGIKTLLHDQGLTIKGAQKLLREKGVKHVSALGLDPQQDADNSNENVIDLKVADANDAVAEVPETLPDPGPEPEPEPQRVEPTAWDPDDPWPADPVPKSDDGPVLTPLEPGDGVAVFSAPEAAESEGSEQEQPVDDAISAAEAPRQDDAAEPEEIALPFVRARQAKVADDPPVADGWIPDPPPALPDLAAVVATPGLLTALSTTSSVHLKANAHRIAPLAARLAALRDQVAASDR